MKLKSLKSSVESMPTVSHVRTATKPMYMILADSAASNKKVEMHAKRLSALIGNANMIAEERELISSFRDNLKMHGASESLMACINAEDQLARCLGIVIPEINAVNATAVGISCCEAIEEKLECSCGLVCKFMKDLLESVGSYTKSLSANAECQKETLKVVFDEIINSVKFIKAEEFAKEEICGYAQPVFMERAAAIKELVDGILAVSSEADAEKFIPALKKLGYVVEQNIEVREETINEAKAEEPPKEEVMNAPVETAEKSEEELEQEAAEGKPVEETPEESKAAVPAPAEGVATDDLQEEEVAVLRWTPTTIGEAAKTVIDLLADVEKLVALGDKVNGICKEAIAKCDAEGEKSADVQAKLDADRRFASFLSTVLHLLGTCINELVDQVVGMSAVVKKFEAPAEEEKTDVVPVEEVTQSEPLGDKCSKAGKRFAKLKAEDEEPKANDPAVEQPKVEQPEGAEANPVAPMTLPNQPKPEEGAEPAVAPEEGGKQEPVEPVEPKLDDDGLIEDPIVAPTTAPVPQVNPVEEPAPAPAQEVPAAPAQPEADPIAPVAPPAPEGEDPKVEEEPIVAPVPAPIQNNVNGEEAPKAVPAPAEPVEPPKGAEPVKLDPALDKPVTDPVPEEKIVPGGKEEPASKVMEARSKGTFWF